MTAVQLLQIPLATDAWLDPAVADLLASFRGTASITASFHASQHEDSKVAGFAIVWNSLESQKNWANSEQGVAFQAHMQAIASDPVHHDVVVFTEDVEPTLAAKAVELVSWIHPSSSIDEKKMNDVERGFKTFQNAISTQAPELEGGLVGGWGQTEFDYNGTPSRRWTALIGWKSVQAHYNCKKTAPFTENIHWLMDHNHSEMEMVHFFYSRLAGEIVSRRP